MSWPFQGRGVTKNPQEPVDALARTGQEPAQQQASTTRRQPKGRNGPRERTPAARDRLRVRGRGQLPPVTATLVVPTPLPTLVPRQQRLGPRPPPTGMPLRQPDTPRRPPPPYGYGRLHPRPIPLLLPPLRQRHEPVRPLRSGLPPGPLPARTPLLVVLSPARTPHPPLLALVGPHRPLPDPNPLVPVLVGLPRRLPTTPHRLGLPVVRGPKHWTGTPKNTRPKAPGPAVCLGTTLRPLVPVRVVLFLVGPPVRLGPATRLVPGPRARLLVGLPTVPGPLRLRLALGPGLGHPVCVALARAGPQGLPDPIGPPVLPLWRP